MPEVARGGGARGGGRGRGSERGREKEGKGEGRKGSRRGRGRGGGGRGSLTTSAENVHDNYATRLLLYRSSLSTSHTVLQYAQNLCHKITSLQRPALWHSQSLSEMVMAASSLDPGVMPEELLVSILAVKCSVPSYHASSMMGTLTATLVAPFGMSTIYGPASKSIPPEAM